MKKSILLFCLALALSTASYSQYEKGDKLINAGIGLSAYSGGLTFGASFEYGITDAISAGVSLDFYGSNYVTTGPNYSYLIFYPGIRGSYHFNELLNLNVKKLDLYATASLGYRAFVWQDTYTVTGNLYNSGIFVGAHAGARYYLTDNIGAFLEVGANFFGPSSAKTGIAIKF
jgi:hypothetical protein